MSAGTKVTVAIVVLFAVVLGVYYGFGGPDGRLPAALLPPAEEDPFVEPRSTDPLVQDAGRAKDGDLARSIEEALWSQGGATTENNAATGVLGSDAVSAVTQPDDPWVLRAPTLMPEPEARPLGAGTPRSPRTVEYIVQPGDSMWTIARRWYGDGIRWREIANGNPEINPERLNVGQRLQLPARDDTRTVGLNRSVSIPATRAMTPVPAGTGRQYTVLAGDTLSTIAEDQYRSESRWREIYQANRTAIGGNPDRLKVGMKLRIP
ncbi:MAG: LysM peptidoglycan-binding domain-containing protein [Phycisphaerales bacterium]